MSPSRLYLNKVSVQFGDVTESSDVAAAQGLCTGATMADVNGDGLLDIYICRSRDSDPARRRNLLCQSGRGKIHREAAAGYGLADARVWHAGCLFSITITMATWIYSWSAIPSTNMPRTTRKRRRCVSGGWTFANKLYRNDDEHFADVSKEAGITSNVLTLWAWGGRQ